ncbi:MAG TPA: ABC transporter permease subunit [Candidatus Paceibacterota bacterium]|nr:ABC transporter permease subunit [Candidatus Paceibacterota bacterium]
MSAPAKRHHHFIYNRYWHVFVTLLVVVIPIIFFLIFAEITKITFRTLFSDIGISLVRLAIAFVISIILGWVCAVIFYRGKASTVALPIFDVLQSVPTFAALPFAVMYWGPSPTTVIFFLVLAMIWPVLFSVINSLKLIKGEYYEAITIYGLSGWKRVRYFLFPVSVPGLITGAIIGLGDTWEALIATEIIVGVKTGLGPFFNSFSNNPTITMFAILGVLLIIFAINRIVFLPLLERSHSLVEE